MTNTTGHRTRTRQWNRQETGTTVAFTATTLHGGASYYRYTPKANEPTYGLPIERIKRVAGILLILLMLLFGLSPWFGNCSGDLIQSHRRHTDQESPDDRVYPQLKGNLSWR